MSANKDKGTKAETAVVRFFHEYGWPEIERRQLEGKNDRGDISGMKGVVIEVKAEIKPSFGVYRKEALTEARNDGGSIPIVVWKRPNKNIKQWVSSIPIKVIMGEIPKDGFDPDGLVRWADLALEDMLWYLKEMGY